MRVLTKTLDSIQNQGIKPVVTKALLNPGSSAVCCTYKNWYKLHKGRIDFFFPLKSVQSHSLLSFNPQLNIPICS